MVPFSRMEVSASFNLVINSIYSHVNLQHILHLYYVFGTLTEIFYSFSPITPPFFFASSCISFFTCLNVFPDTSTSVTVTLRESSSSSTYFLSFCAFFCSLASVSLIASVFALAFDMLASSLFAHIKLWAKYPPVKNSNAITTMAICTFLLLILFILPCLLSS